MTGSPDHDDLCPCLSTVDPCACDALAAARADERLKVAQAIEADERIDAWEAVARHPTLKPAFDVDGALLPAVLTRLTDLGDLESLILELKPEPRSRRIRRKMLGWWHDAARIARNGGRL